MKEGLEALKKLPFIKDLRDECTKQNPTNKELSDAFNKALKIQDITTKDHICHFFHICYQWIHETLIGSYNVQSTLEEKTEHNNSHNTFQTFLNSTNNTINHQKYINS